MANPKLTLDITAQDRTAAAFRSVENNFGKIAKGTPVQGLTDKFGQMISRGNGLGGLARSIFSVGDAGRIAGGGIGEAAGEMGSLAAGAGVAGLATAGIVGALGAAGFAAYKFEADFTKSGASVVYQAEKIGISAQQLQIYQMAGKRFGVSADAMASSLGNVGTAIQDAFAGRNQTALQLMGRLGITMKRNADGSIDAANAMEQIADKTRGMNAETKRMVLNVFGLSAAENYVNASTKARADAQDAAARSGGTMTAKQLADSTRFQASVEEMSERWQGLLNVLSTNLIIPWLQPTVDWLGKLFDLMNKIDWVKLGTIDKDLFTGQAWKIPGDIFAPASTAPAPAEAAPASRARNRRGAASARSGAASGTAGGPTDTPDKPFGAVVGYYEKRGWSPEQSAGIAGNLQAESGFSTHPRGSNDGGQATGLAQWHGARQAAFARWAGHSIRTASFNEELGFVDWELTHGAFKGAGDRLRRAKTAYEAGAIVSRFYEVPRDKEGQARARGRLAELGLRQSIIPAAGAPARAAPQGVEVASNSPAAHGKVHVSVTIKGAPAGSKVLAQASGRGVRATARIAPTMAGATV